MISVFTLFSISSFLLILFIVFQSLWNMKLYWLNHKLECQEENIEYVEEYMNGYFDKAYVV